MYILGLSCFYHDSAACLMEDDHVLCASEEERLSRKKHDSGFPEKSAKWCLDYAGISAKDVDYIGFYDKPLQKFHRILQTYVAKAPRGISSFVSVMPLWFREKLWIPDLIRDTLNYDGEIIFLEHHTSHAASAFFSSPFIEAAILTADGVGEWTTTSLGTGVDNRTQINHEIHFPHSLGLLYNAFTYYLGFRVNSDEYKVMGASSYGKPAYYDLIMKELIDVKDDGSYRLNMDYFPYTHDVKMINEKFEQLFGYSRRQPNEEFQRHHFDIAMSIQKVTEETILRMANFLYKETHLKKLCMGGGLGLNCVTNARIRRETPFRDIFVQPAAGDSGGAMGAAAFIYYTWLGNKRKKLPEPDRAALLSGNDSSISVKPIMTNAYLGPEFKDGQYATISI